MVAAATIVAGIVHVWRAGQSTTDVEAAIFVGAAIAQVLAGALTALSVGRSITVAAAVDLACVSAYLVIHAPEALAGTMAFDPIGVSVVGLQLLAVAAWVIVEIRPRRTPEPATLASEAAVASPASGHDLDVDRRRFIVAGSVGAAALLVGGSVGRIAAASGIHHPSEAVAELADVEHPEHEGMLIGEVDHARNGFDPTAILEDWDLGEVSILSTGQTLRSYTIIAQNTTIEIAPGVFFESWNYNGRVPGPSIRCQEGDRVRVEFINGGTHPHTMHFHGIHSAAMDGVPGIGAGNIVPGDRTVYEFDAFPFGTHLYHCHTSPLKRHIHKGLYGAFVIDPDPARHPDQADLAVRRTVEGARAAGIREFMMIMNGFDTNFDGENEVYAANTVAFHYARHPIRVGTEDRIRIYLANLTEFDPINSLHLHANFFDYYDHGTTLEPTLRTIDTVMQSQAQRGILEFDFSRHPPGRYMFHAHQSEFVELGWMSFFEVVEGRTI